MKRGEPLKRTGELKRKTPMKSKSGKKRTKPARPCTWSNRCYTQRVPIVVSETERYCKVHGLKVADMETAVVVKLRDRKCQCCDGAGEDWRQSLECAHVLSRGNRYIRFDFENMLALCRGCHFRFTQAPAQWQVWIEERTPGILSMLSQREIAGRRAGGHIDLAAVICRMRRLQITTA